MEEDERCCEGYLMTCKCDGRAFGFSPLLPFSPSPGSGAGAAGAPPTSEATGSPDTVNAKP